MEAFMNAGSVIVILLGVFYASRSLAAWANEFLCRIERKTGKPRASIGISPDLERELELMIKKAAWIGYWKGVLLMLGSMIATEAFVYGNRWLGILIYGVIGFVILIRLKQSPRLFVE